MTQTNIKLTQSKDKNSILFTLNQPKGNKLSILSVYYQTFAYYDQILTNIVIPLQLLIFVYKYNILFYESNVIAGQIILLVIGFFLNIWRLNLGKSGNKGKKYGHIAGYLIFTIILIIGFFYIVAIQPNILWLEFIIFIIVLVISIIQFLIMIVLAIFYRINDI